ncbi:MULTISPECIES: ATP-binding protein [Enterobacteriaceae]|uniref:ATP-binding protein n=1 Tax=Enterobacteriaceae TaxID=543 RepID=UPI000237D261|nr:MULTISPECIES: ATP-binding protein [Enterobacteriaceae]QNE50923.1 HAMP domain-containing protein [Klebsiella michiganensis]
MMCHPGRLFWKLSLALFLCMLLTVASAVAYILLTGSVSPTIPQGAAAIGPIPVLPMISGLFAVIITGFTCAWYFSRPIQRLSRALAQVANGHFDTRVVPLMGGRRDELADLGHDFDQMVEQLQKAVESQRVLFHDISHELRSPLARMQAAIGLSRQDHECSQEMLSRIEIESMRLDAMIDELLTLHSLGDKAVVEKRDRIDLIELLQAIIDDADFEARGKKRKVIFHTATEKFIAEVQGELIYRAFENVIRNAVKYTAQHDVVEVCSYIENNSMLVVSISDRGPGVAPELQDKIFEPFFRINGSLVGRGAGLGLAIAKRAVTAHGGNISANNRKAGGLKIIITIPMTY